MHNRLRAREVTEVALAKTSEILATTIAVLATDLALDSRTSHENVNGVVRLFDILEAVLEVLKVDLAGLWDLGAPFGIDSPTIGQNALTALCFFLQSQELVIVTTVARSLCSTAASLLELGHLAHPGRGRVDLLMLLRPPHD
jgi:hypothetical protein